LASYTQAEKNPSLLFSFSYRTKNNFPSTLPLLREEQPWFLPNICTVIYTTQIRGRKRSELKDYGGSKMAFGSVGQ
jgi:hypothetical protein